LPVSSDKWFDGVDFEVRFWQSWLNTKGGPWPEDYRTRLDAAKPFDPLVEEAIRDTSSREIDILDVGAGPITSLGYVSKKFDIKITATDPLADAYAVLLQEAGVSPPVRTQACFAENLLSHFGGHRFDVCHSRNALDHSLDPRTALRAMAQLLHPHGLMYVRVHRNEGETARYSGLHNWNFDKDANNNFILWRASERYNINEDVADFIDGRLAELKSEDGGHELIFIGYRKAS
jgi:SAM-dependent methyltransferase